MKIKILSWNVRGADDAKKRKMIKAFLKTQRAVLVCLQETKLKGVTWGLSRSLSMGSFVDWVAVDAIGASRGILIFWDSRMFQLVDLEATQSLLSCKFRNLEDNFTWVFFWVFMGLRLL